MSFLALPTSVEWLQTADDNQVRIEHYRMCLQDYAEWLRASGVDPFHIADPATFVAEGDLQLHSNVVNDWAKDASASHRAPTLYDILQHLKTTTPAEHVTFHSVLAWYAQRLRDWAIANRKDPDNLNETREQREARLNRERVARHRLRHTAGSDDPELDALIKHAKAAMENAVAGRKWLKGAERQAKLDCDAAIAAAKATRADTVSRAIQAVETAEQQAHAAQSALDAYKALAK